MVIGLSRSQRSALAALLGALVLLVLAQAVPAFGATAGYTGGPNAGYYPRYVSNDHTAYALRFSAAAGTLLDSAGTAVTTAGARYYVKVRLSPTAQPSESSSRGFTWNPTTREWVQEHATWRDFPTVTTGQGGAITAGSTWWHFKFGDTSEPSDAGSARWYLIITLKPVDGAEHTAQNNASPPVVTVMDMTGALDPGTLTSAFRIHNGAATFATEARRIEAVPGRGSSTKRAGSPDYFSSTFLPGQAIVSLRFDDGAQQDWDLVYPLLRERGLRASFAVVYNLIGLERRLTVGQMRQLEREGNEIVCHSITHGFEPASFAEFEHETVDAKRAFEELGFTITSFSIPGTWGMEKKSKYFAYDSTFFGTPADRLLRRHYYAYEGFVEDIDGGGKYRTLPVTGDVPYGFAHFEDGGIAQIDTAIARGAGIQLLWHSRNIGREGEKSVADLTRMLDHVAAKVATGEVVCLTDTEQLYAVQASSDVWSLSSTENNLIAQGYGSNAKGDFQLAVPVGRAFDVRLENVIWPASAGSYTGSLADVDVALGAADMTPPAAPASLTARAGDGHVLLSWPAVAGASTYTVYKWQAAAPINGTTNYTPQHMPIATVATTSCDVPGLTNGTQYFFEVRAEDAATNVGPPTATQAATPQPGARLTLETSADTVDWGGSATLTGVLTDGVVALTTGQQVRAEYSLDGSTWRLLRLLYPLDTFTYSVTVEPKRRTTYRLVLEGDATHPGAISPSITVVPRVKLGRPLAPSSVWKGRSFTAYGDLIPRAAAGSRTVKIRCYLKTSGVWQLKKTVPSVNADDSRQSRYSARFSLPVKGTWKLVAFAASTSRYAATTSAAEFLDVK